MTTDQENEAKRQARVRRMNSRRQKPSAISYAELLAKHSLPDTIADIEAGRKGYKKQKELFAAEEAV
jgi:hypothetical protein